MNPKVPTQAQLTEWYKKIDGLMNSRPVTMHNDLPEVIRRLSAENGTRTIQGGCAYRILRQATRLRAHGGYGQTAQKLYELARDIIVHECSPSPGWQTMCMEEGWPYEAVEANDF